MKLRNLTYLNLFLLILTSCNKTNELYPGDAYDTGVFDNNYYTEHNHVDQLTIKNTNIFNASYNPTSADNKVFISNPLSRNDNIAGLKGEDQCYDSKNYGHKTLNWRDNTPEIDNAENENGYGYGPTYNLSSISNDFKYGFLSRLYDGRVRCSGHFAKSRVQLTSSGFSTFFPKELNSATYFAMSLVGKTSFEGATNTSIIDFSLSFYRPLENQEYEKIIFNINDVVVPYNTGGEASLLLFYFEDVIGENYSEYINGITAMSLSYTLKNITIGDKYIEQYGVPSVDKDDGAKSHLAVMLYEVLFPKSIWR